jgi:hypothetical protein
MIVWREWCASHEELATLYAPTRGMDHRVKCTLTVRARAVLLLRGGVFPWQRMANPVILSMETTIALVVSFASQKMVNRLVLMGKMVPPCTGRSQCQSGRCHVTTRTCVRLAGNGEGCSVAKGNDDCKPG